MIQIKPRLKRPKTLIYLLTSKKLDERVDFKGLLKRNKAIRLS